jgi:hypothetical protein
VEVGSAKFTLNRKTKKDYQKYAVETAKLFKINESRAETELNDSIEYLVNLTDEIRARFKRFKTIDELNANFPDLQLIEIFDAVLTEDTRKAVSQFRVDIGYANNLLNVTKSYQKR